MALILRTVQELQKWRRQIVDKSVGFVPTMGALHEGHATLLRRSVTESDLTVLSVFVNPTQFNNLALADREKVDVIFAPEKSEMYPDNYRFKLTENSFSLLLCGKDRPGHFDGVLSVVLKLFNLVQPTKAYFGEKDYQQFSLIRDMTSALFLPVEIVPVPTVREADGLAMSSRNVRLTLSEREKVPLIYKTISSAPSANAAADILSAAGWKVDYVADIDGRRFAAVNVGAVRLIDNVQI